MCPDKETLSAWFDGELPGRAGDKIESHLVECAECRDQISRWEALSLNLQPCDPEISDETRARVWAHIKEQCGLDADPRTFSKKPGKIITFSRKLVLPAAAAAAAFLAIFSASVIHSRIEQRIHLVAGAECQLEETSTEEMPQLTSSSTTVRPSLSDSAPPMSGIAAVSSHAYSRNSGEGRQLNQTESIDEMNRLVSEMFSRLQEEGSQDFWFQLPENISFHAEGEPGFELRGDSDE